MSTKEKPSKPPGKAKPPEGLRRKIVADSYLFRPTQWGWSCTKTTDKTDRFHANYHVVLLNGVPSKCSCPQFVKAGKPCKHMAEVVKILAERRSEAPTKIHVSPPPPEKTESKAPEKAEETGVKRFYLRHANGWFLKYEVLPGGKDVMVTRSYKGERVHSWTMPAQEARTHYRGALKGGFNTPQGDL